MNAAEVPPLSAEIFSLIDEGCIPGGTQSNLLMAEQFTDWGNTNQRMRILLSDAQTSGGLLLCVPPKHLAEVKQVLVEHRTIAAAIIGTIVRSRAPRIVVQA